MQIAILAPDGALAYRDVSGDEHEQSRVIRDIVGDHLQLVPIEFHDCDAFVNADGAALELARNHAAEQTLNWPDALLGSVVVTGGLEQHHDVGLSPSQRDALNHAAGQHYRSSS